MFELCPKEFLYPPATPPKILHFTQQANPNQGIQPDPGHGTNVTNDQYRVCVAQYFCSLIYFHFNIKAYHFILFTDFT